MQSNSVKDVQDKSTWEIVLQMGNDSITTNGNELPQCISFLLKGLIRRQKANFAIISPRLCFGYAPLNAFVPDLYPNTAHTSGEVAELFINLLTNTLHLKFIKVIKTR